MLYLQGTDRTTFPKYDDDLKKGDPSKIARLSARVNKPGSNEKKGFDWGELGRNVLGGIAIVAVAQVANAVVGTLSSTAEDGGNLGGIAGAVLGTMSAIASVSEDGNIDDEDMEDMLTEVYKLLVGANIVSFGHGSSSDSSDDLSNKAKSLFDEVTGIGRDFIIGTGHSVDRDIFFGVEGINDSDMPNTTSYKVGSAFGDVLSIFAGESEMTVGGGGEVIGVALDGTVVLSPAGVAANVASAGLFVHGGHTMYEGASNLGKDLASFSSADGGGGEADGLKQYPDGSIRDSKGHFAGKTGTVPGTPGVDKAMDIIKNDAAYKGYDILGTEISVRGTDGTLRRYDVVARKPDGSIVGIEVKSGTATRTAQQKLIDNELLDSGGLDTVGDRARRIGVDRIDTVEVIKVK